MLERLRLRNFQCHKDLMVRFGRITVITGENGAGKSAVVRALRWLALNEWDGGANDHVTEGADESNVLLTFDDGKRILRIKGKSRNSYHVEGGERKAFGTDVPREVVERLRIVSASFQRQSDPAFWISLTGGQAAVALNEIFSLEAIDKSLGAVGAEVRQAKAREAVGRERLAASRKEKVRLAWTREADAELKELEALHERIGVVARGISETEEQIVCNERARRAADVLCNQRRLAQSTLRLAESLQELDGRIQEVKALITLEEEVQCLAKSLATKQARLAKLLAGKCPMCGRG